MRRTFFVVVIGLIPILGVLDPARAGPLDTGFAAYGRGDYAEAAKWYRVAAEQGNADAQFNLGAMYDLGIGVLQNHAEAVKWYRLAANRRHVLAQFNLGTKYRLGQGVQQNHGEAVKWFRLAAEQGDGKAQNSLGAMYGDGEGVPQNHVFAHMWFNLAGAQGNTVALKNRDRTAAKMTPTQIADAQRLAAQWKPK